MPKQQAAPAFSLADLNGKTVSNQNLQGKVTFINFWFPSCPGCVSEMPKVIKMANDYQGKDFQVLGIAQPIDPPESVREYVRQYGLPFTVMYDTGGVAGKAFETKVYPTSVLINKKGEVLKTFVGEPDFTALYREIDSELEK
ncbi:peroxiredoxin family protein [Neisseria chenwenguii]|uniref:Thioredoxin n=1 Tax=Neisseria chenwenguii TaxID=1853278 RepID=A0A220S3T1_9NEIS|nr:thioredoxin [Neisseria chenwenguii]ROV57202.1 TlpA family protein disulfide reductase [Neisseria chenwenguii]